VAVVTKKRTKAMLSARAYEDVLGEVVRLIQDARRVAARSINSVMTTAYWEIGRRIVEHEQGGVERARYGEALLARLSDDLTSRFGRGFSVDRLETARLFYLAYATPVISATASRKLPPSKSATLSRNSPDLPVDRFALSWSHYVLLIRRTRSVIARDFYESEAIRGGWTVRQLERQIESQFYERIALSRNKAAMLKKGALAKSHDAVTPEEEIKDPFILEFLALKDEYSESDLEEALVAKLESFLLELGGDFAFVGRQRRLRIASQWFRVDLVFYHRRLRCLVIIDLKLGHFTHADAGQMHLYLNYARENWMVAGENPPVGLILCASKENAVARYALEGLPNKVLAAEYRTALPNERFIAETLSRTRHQLERRPGRRTRPRRAK
jgi:predicted nuclease of restriction endonuclease-like (RecB) superfamily